jgi:dTDP-4-amino-4,6-dideoxygalactose transaminase
MNESRNSAPLATWPAYSEEEIDAVQQVLRSGKVNYWTGEEGREFEREYAAYVGVEHAIALANGSVALELALRALDIGPGDEVIVTPRSFIASASCIVVCGATPVFADVDRESQAITAATIEPLIGPRTRAIVLVHLAGWPCEMDPIISLARERGLKVIEDCAQAHGARYKGMPVGSFGDAAAFSFCQDKIITTGGEGGMLVTRTKALWEKAWSYKDHGKGFDAVYRARNKDETGFRWVHESFGTNFRMTEMQAVIGRIQLRRLDDWIVQRRRNAQVLIDGLADQPLLRIPLPDDQIYHAYYKFYAFLRPARLRTGWTRDRIIGALNLLGVPCFSGSCSEIYREKAFADSPFVPAKPLPVARELGDTSLMFVVHPSLAEADMRRMSAKIRQVLSDARS